MKEDKITIARLWPRYRGKPESRINIITRLDPKKYRTIGIYLTKHSEKSNPLEEKGYKVFYLSNGKGLNWFSLPILYKLIKILKAEKVDIIHSHRDKCMVYGVVASLIARTPAVIVHVHGFARTRNWHRKLRNFFLMKKINKVATVGEAVREDVLKTNPSARPEKVCSLGNSIEYAQFAEAAVSKEEAKNKLKLPNNGIIFGTIGRLTPSKGQIYLVNAFANVKQAIPTAQLVFVGDGPFRVELASQATKMGVAEAVYFLGHRTDIPEVLRAFDVFVLPSIGSEGLPRAIMEAMAAGVPCLGASSCGIPEILGNGEFGYLVPPRDSRALAEAMIKLAQMSQAERNRIIEKAKQRVKDEYVPEVVVKRIEGIYDELAVQTGVVSQYYVISYPKSGRTWLRLMIAKLLQVHFGLKVKKKHFLEIKRLSNYDKRIPSVEVTRDPDGQSTRTKDIEDLKKSLKRYSNSNVIFLVRDPRDVIVSKYFQATKRPKEDPEQFFRGAISEYIRDERRGVDDILKFCNIWASQRNIPKDFLLVRYEDLHRNTLEELKRIISFMGIKDATEEELAEAVNFAFFENMQKMERKDYFRRSMLRPGNAKDPESYKTRRGKVKGFYDYLSKDDIEYLNQKLSKELDGFFGYNFV